MTGRVGRQVPGVESALGHAVLGEGKGTLKQMRPGDDLGAAATVFRRPDDTPPCFRLSFRLRNAASSFARMTRSREKVTSLAVRAFSNSALSHGLSL